MSPKEWGRNKAVGRLARPMATPETSASERDAIEAGGVSWESELFTGDSDWAKPMERKPAALSAEEAETVRRARAARDAVVRADEFTPDPSTTHARLAGAPCA